MQLTPGQLRSTIGLSVEAYRHWKRVLPPFAARKGYAPCFSLGDVVAASILHRLTERGGVRVGRLKTISAEIVRLCNRTPWASLRGRALIVDLVNSACRMTKDRLDATCDDFVFLCPLDPVLAELHETLPRVYPASRQGHLPFPPTEIGHAPLVQGGRS